MANSVLRHMYGRFVRIYTDIQKKVSDPRGNTHELPLIFEGYLVDEDEKYYYLSYDAALEPIASVVRKEIEIAMEDVELTQENELKLEEQATIAAIMQNKPNKAELN